MTHRLRRAVLLGVVLTAELAGCTRAPATPTAEGSGSVVTVSARQVGGNELRYGVSASTSGGVVYQPDVVVIGGGADSVRSVSADGLTWTIDGNAPGANDLAVGKIMLATSFGAGRVLKLAREGTDERVTLGPVSLTDLVREAHLDSSAPVALTNGLYYAAGPPNTAAHGTHAWRERRLTGGTAFRSTPAPSAAPMLPAPTASPTTVGAGAFQVSPFCCAGGAGVHVFYDQGGGRLSATLTLTLATPSASFHLDISGGRLREASVQLHGAGSLRIDIQAATLTSAGNIKTDTLAVPETLAIPLGGPLPLTLTLTQNFNLSMQLSGRAALNTHGEYTLSGDLGFGYRNGAPFIDTTTATVANPMTANTTSLGVATNAIQLGWGLKASVGVGLLGFSAGAWYQLGVGVALTAAATLDPLHPGCVRDSVLVSGRYGVGYTAPKLLVDAVNSILGLAGVKPIPASGGPSWGPVPIWRPNPGNYCP